jgi:hypothetical protein
MSKVLNIIISPFSIFYTYKLALAPGYLVAQNILSSVCFIAAHADTT